MISKQFSSLMRFFLIVVVATMFNVGCASSGASNSNSLTGGLSMEMSISGKNNFAALYRVEQDGTIHFGGGMDARINKTSWTGQLTESDVKQLTELLTTHGWFTDITPSSKKDDDREYRVQLRWPGGRNNFKLAGRSSSITPVEDLLAQFANRRHNIFLESLPKASEVSD